MMIRKVLKSQRIFCALAALFFTWSILPVMAENGDQAPPRESTPKVELDAGFFDFSKTLDGIMKPDAKTGGKAPSPDKKPEDKPVQAVIQKPPKPAKKPDFQAEKAELADVPIDTSITIKPSQKPDLLQRDTKVTTLTKPADIKGNFKKEMSAKDAELYQEIFALQKEGDMDKANALAKKLKDYRLYGYVLKNLYLHPTAYTSSFDELRDWLDKYADHPGAERIYALAERKRPAGNNTRLTEPDTKIRITRRAEPTMIVAKRYASSINRTDEEAAAVRQFQSTITMHIRNGNPSAAQNTLESVQILDTVEYDIIASRIASAYLYKGDTKSAYNLASKAAARSGLHVPVASWIAGLVSWKRGKYSQSAQYFENVGRSKYASSWTRSGGAYWAARSHMRRGDVKSVSTWLRRASASPRTFYGLIATRALGEDFEFNWKMPTFTKDNHKILSSNPRGSRAIALAKIGEISKAQAELLRIDKRDDLEMTSALLAFAGYARLPGLAMRLGANAVNEEQNLYYDAALYPVGPWKPYGGYEITPALVNAIMRQESRFDPDAESASGAKGLMQLMPATAKSVSDYDSPQMNDPEVNLALGQRYLMELLKSSRVDNNLLSLLIAYNAGPGNLNKWQRQWDKVSDPLLFIELLPSSETRSYVERVLSNYWIYRMRDRQETPTLDAVVAGAPVKFAG